MPSASEFVRQIFSDLILKHIVAAHPEGWGWHVKNVEASGECTKLVLHTYTPIQHVQKDDDDINRAYSTAEVTVYVEARMLRVE
jgi:hypothetical protein